jgi:hypothetical protein
MTHLSKNAQQRIREYITEHARPLEQARYAYHFVKPKNKKVLTALEAFQNEDGGFGHGLEPDIQLADSSVIATTLAFQLFREVEAHFAKPIVRGACDYLKATYDTAHQTWANVPPHVGDAPHAPWWTPPEDMTGYMANPRAEIVGYLYDYAKNFDEAPFGESWRTGLTQSVVSWLLNHDNEMEQHDLLCFVRLARTTDLPDGVRLVLRRRLEGVLRASVTTSDFEGYGLTPLDVLTGPADPFAYLFDEALNTQLDLVVATFEEQPYIEPPWQWEGEAWQQARQAWRGMLTVNRMVQLKRFGRLEE